MGNISNDERTRRAQAAAELAASLQAAQSQAPATLQQSPAAAAEIKSKDTVSMKRDPSYWPPPHTADVHSGQVAEWIRHGWMVA